MTDASRWLAELMFRVSACGAKNTQLTPGQVFYYALLTMDPMLARALRHSTSDPFYDDRLLPEAWDVVRKAWSK